MSRPVAKRLVAFGLETVGDLIAHTPRRYAELQERKLIRDLRVGEEATVRGRVEGVSRERTARRGVAVVRAAVRDESGAVEAVWFNQQYLAQVLTEGTWLSLRGTYRPQAGHPSFVVRTHEIVADCESEVAHTEGIVPVYPASEQVSSRVLRDAVRALRSTMRRLPDPLPAALRVSERLPSRADALTGLHMPRDLEEARSSRARMVLEELLLMQLGLQMHKARQRQRATASPLPRTSELTAAFVAALPFVLTEHQERAIAELDEDLRGDLPMRRLLQGDVGSGKTVVALHCLVRAVENGHQGALIAPTETLVRQHAATAARYVGALVPMEVVTSALTGRERAAALARIASGAAALVVGTQALLQEDVQFHDLAVLVVDEQHRFGVEQRDALVRRAERGGCAPHVLHMTATPIPRTLALTLYGDLDVTTIEGLPSGRQKVVTSLVDEAQREEGYDFVRRQLRAGGQAYVVCPAIEESEAIDAATTIAEAERLRTGPFSEFRVGVAHGQLKSGERDAVMRAFAAGDVDVLVTTSLVEVGLDVSRATVMLIEGAERFGLAQLHQLRGRVGRSSTKSYCMLFSHVDEGPGRQRLEALLRTQDGFALAEADLEIRGEGEVLGARQAGVPGLKFARLTRDRDALVRARILAAEILATDARLETAANAPLRAAVAAAFGDELAWLLRA